MYLIEIVAMKRNMPVPVRANSAPDTAKRSDLSWLTLFMPCKHSVFFRGSALGSASGKSPGANATAESSCASTPIKVCHRVLRVQVILVSTYSSFSRRDRDTLCSKDINASNSVSEVN
jgi:hypothetical protein